MGGTDTDLRHGYTHGDENKPLDQVYIPDRAGREPGHPQSVDDIGDNPANRCRQHDDSGGSGCLVHREPQDEGHHRYHDDPAPDTQEPGHDAEDESPQDVLSLVF